LTIGSGERQVTGFFLVFSLAMGFKAIAMEKTTQAYILLVMIRLSFYDGKCPV
jgi:hypothetical protein